MTRIDRLYILTTTLLLAHQVDSAYWHEWDLFGIPGGIQVFVLLNVLVTLPFLAGLARVAKGARGGGVFALALALVGVATFCIHVAFAMRGHREFGLPVSWVLLCGTLLSSLGLGWRAISECRRTHAPEPDRIRG
jgi:Kef-type K+ transport system membrane component KefB